MRNAQHRLTNVCDPQVAQKVGRRRGFTQREGKKPKPQGRVYLEYPSHPVTAKEGENAAAVSFAKYNCFTGTAAGGRNSKHGCLMSIIWANTLDANICLAWF